MEVDPQKLRLFSFLVFSKLEGAVTSGMIHLGDRLGIYRRLAASDVPLTVDEIATALELHPRWVSEWAHNQAAASIIGFVRGEDGVERFHLSPEARLVLAEEEHPAFGMGMFHRLPQTMGSLHHLPESFRTGLGRDYDSHGPEGAVGIERSFEPWSRAFLIPVVLPALDGLVEALQRGRVWPTSAVVPAVRQFRWPNVSRRVRSWVTTSRGSRSIAPLRSSPRVPPETSRSPILDGILCHRTDHSTW